MKHTRRIALCAAALAASVTAGAIGTSSPAGAVAKTKTVTMSGTMHCSLTGSIALSPAFTTNGSGTSSTVTLHGKLTACGGTKGFTRHGVTITGGKITATGTAKDNSCVATATSGTLPRLKGEATFSAKGGKAKPTKFVFSGGSFDASSSPITVSYPGSGDTAKATGSFAGSKGGSTAELKQSLDDLLSSCGSSSGLSAMKLSSGTATFG